MANANPTMTLGTMIANRYKVVSVLGSGKSGEVYLVWDEHLKDHVALKLLYPVAGAPATWEEAQILKQLSGDYLLPVINADVAYPLDLRYITTPHMTGGDLAAKAKGRGVSTGLAIRWATQIAHGLARMHGAGLLHRDVKPGNAYLDANLDVLLGDLGGAMLLDPDGTAPMLGTPATVAPEVITLQRCTMASDIYSLAATTFYLLAGDYPVNARGGNTSVLRRVVAGTQRDLRDVAPHTPLAIASVVGRALSVDASGRPNTALDFANALAAARRHERDWERSDHHSGHQFCLTGSPQWSRQAVCVCAVPGSAGRWDVTVVRQGGRHVRAHEARGLRYDDLLVHLRKVTAKV